MNTVVMEKPAIATALLPYRIDKKVEQSTPRSVTKRLDILNKLNPTEDTFVLAPSTISPKALSK
jgi:hypothetical protein